jgi:hypothetical protein
MLEKFSDLPKINDKDIDLVYTCDGSVNPTKISIIWPTRVNDKAYEAMDSIAGSCSDNDCIEILFKIDNKNQVEELTTLSNRFPCSIKIYFNELLGLDNMHLFQNYLAKEASGKLLFFFGDDLTIEGDWVKYFWETRSFYKDQIYVVNTRGHVWSPFPIITKEWVDILGFVSPFYMSDSWMQTVANLIYRHTHLPDESDVKITHNHIGPPGYKTLPKWFPKKIRHQLCRLAPYAAKILRQHMIEDNEIEYNINQELDYILPDEELS